MVEELERYVNRLFSGYRPTAEVEELKKEIISNLEAKVEDLMESGMTSEEAFARATADVSSVEHLISGHQSIYINRFKVELVQMALLYGLVAWVLTIPLRFTLPGILANSVLMAGSVICALVYISLAFRKEEGYYDTTAVLNVSKLSSWRTAAWIVWGLYIAASTAYTTSMRFGGAIWYGSGIHIDGPYQFAAVAIDYVVPLFTIVVPLLLDRAGRLIIKHEVNYSKCGK